MGASRQAYWWEKLLHAVPFTTVWCPDGNRHFRWQRVCWCRDDAFVSLRFGKQWVVFNRSGSVVSMKGFEPPRKIKNRMG